MEGMNKRQKKRMYNKRWIASKRQKMRHTKKLEIEECFDTSSSEKDDENVSEFSLSNTCERQDSNIDVVQQQALESESDLNSDRTDLNEKEMITSETDTDHADVPVISSSDSEDDSDNYSEGFKDLIRVWVNLYDVKANAVDYLLKVLKNNGHSDIPVSARTLLKTPRDIELKKVSGMDYFFFGLETMICSMLKKYPEEVLNGTDTLILSLNIDGLPLFKSSRCAAWPILGAICNLHPCKPFLVTLTVGNSKPTNLDFLVEAIEELDNLLANGVHFNEKHFCITLSCIICDAPAKAFVKCITQYSGYNGCDKCTQKGLHIGRMTYPCVKNLTPRTDQSFRNTAHPGHHKQLRGRSPFENLPVDMISQFPIDYMHQVCLGVTKKLLLTWIRGPRRNTRVSSGQIAQISMKLLYLKRFIPREFARKPRSLVEIDRWKATEFRQFLLYTGQFALRQILPEDLYQHFMCLCVSLSILVNKNLAALHLNYAHELLTYFVGSKELYGGEFLVYNVHSLLHLKDDVQRYGSLDNCAAWMYENYMQKLKRKVRSGTNPAAQLVKRIKESIDFESVNLNEKPHCYSHCKPNNAYLTNTGKYCEIIRYENNEKKYLCRVYHTPENSFEYPCNSELIGQIQFRHLNYEMKTVQADILTTRCIKLQLEHSNNVIFLPLQHNY